VKQIKKQHKYGIKFDSKLELAFYEMLKKEGIKFEFQVTYTLHPSFKYNKSTVRAMTLTVDFDFTKHGKNVIVDTKGFWRESNKQKWKWFKWIMREEHPIILFPKSVKECESVIKQLKTL